MPNPCTKYSHAKILWIMGRPVRTLKDDSQCFYDPVTDIQFTITVQNNSLKLLMHYFKNVLFFHEHATSILTGFEMTLSELHKSKFDKQQLHVSICIPLIRGQYYKRPGHIITF